MHSGKSVGFFQQKFWLTYLWLKPVSIFYIFILKISEYTTLAELHVIFVKTEKVYPHVLSAQEKVISPSWWTCAFFCAYIEMWGTICGPYVVPCIYTHRNVNISSTSVDRIKFLYFWLVDVTKSSLDTFRNIYGKHFLLSFFYSTFIYFFKDWYRCLQVLVFFFKRTGCVW